eukprot:GFYU01011022.1.p1 GENE.GFYU01011022.1~~GFYU01011022.1.p1  ORF type:complete len:362 (+),score=83.04 GFYU01011022.1:51-1088(+)
MEYCCPGFSEAVRDGWKLNRQRDSSVQSLDLRSIEDARMHFFSLKFNGKELETAFQTYYFQHSINAMRISSALCLAFLVLFGALDELQAQLIIRYGGLCPLGLFAIAFSFTKIFKHVFQTAVALCIILMGSGLTVISTMMSNPGFAGVLIMLVYCHTFSKLRFMFATLTGLVIIIIFNLCFSFFTFSGTPSMVYFNFILFTIEVNGMFVSYWFEFYIRKEFLLNSKLRLEQRNLEEIVIMDFIDDARDVLDVPGVVTRPGGSHGTPPDDKPKRRQQSGGSKSAGAPKSTAMDERKMLAGDAKSTARTSTTSVSARQTATARSAPSAAYRLDESDIDEADAMEVQV